MYFELPIEIFRPNTRRMHMQCLRTLYDLQMCTQFVLISLKPQFHTNFEHDAKIASNHFNTDVSNGIGIEDKVQKCSQYDAIFHQK